MGIQIQGIREDLSLERRIGGCQFGNVQGGVFQQSLVGTVPGRQRGAQTAHGRAAAERAPSQRDEPDCRLGGKSGAHVEARSGVGKRGLLWCGWSTGKNARYVERSDLAGVTEHVRRLSSIPPVHASFFGSDHHHSHTLVGFNQWAGIGMAVDADEN